MNDTPDSDSERPPDSVEASEATFALLAVLLYAFMILGGMAWTWLESGTPWPSAHPFGPAARHLPAGLMAALALALLTVWGSARMKQEFEWARKLETEFRKILGPLRPGTVAVFALCSGIGEEWFFRGVLQPALVDWLHSELAGYVLATLIFGGVHFVPRPAYYPWTVFATLMGFVLGGLFWITGSLLPPMLLHILVNWINLTRITGVAAHRNGDAGDGEETAPGS